MIVAVAVGRALAALAGGAGVEQARLPVIAGSPSALGYKSAATLLEAIEFGTWHGIGGFAAIFAPHGDQAGADAGAIWEPGARRWG